MSQFIATDIVTRENIARVWATSPHLIPPLMLVGLHNAPMHWKKRTTIIPGILNWLNEANTKVGGRPAYHSILH